MQITWTIYFIFKLVISISFWGIPNVSDMSRRFLMYMKIIFLKSSTTFLHFLGQWKVSSTTLFFQVLPNHFCFPCFADFISTLYLPGFPWSLLFSRYSDFPDHFFFPGFPDFPQTIYFSMSPPPPPPPTTLFFQVFPDFPDHFIFPGFSEFLVWWEPCIFPQQHFTNNKLLSEQGCPRPQFEVGMLNTTSAGGYMEVKAKTK